jgi:soluble lytic murein transglycosylase-like protein
MRSILAMLLLCGPVHALAQMLQEPPLMPSEATVRRFAPIIEKASLLHGVDEALVHAVIYAESSYDPRAVSPQGAAGLMQLMPETARRYGVRDIFDPAQNIQGGVRFLRDLLAIFGGNVELVIAAYNSGVDAVIRAGNRIPSNPETLAFVPRVVRYYESFRARGG